MGNSSKVTKENEKFSIEVECAEKFDYIVETKYISSAEFCKKISELFKSIYSDFEGSYYEVDQQGHGTISLYFNHAENADANRVAGISREILEDANIKSDTLRRVRLNENRRHNGDRYYLTKEGKEGLADFASNTVINRKNGKIDWSKITAEVSQSSAGWNQPPTVYTKVSMMDPVKLATKIYGATSESGDNLEYAVDFLRSAQMIGGPGYFTPQFMLAIKRVSEKEVVKLCNQMGIAPSQGLDIIR